MEVAPLDEAKISMKVKHPPHKQSKFIKSYIHVNECQTIKTLILFESFEFLFTLSPCSDLF